MLSYPDPCLNLTLLPPGYTILLQSYFDIILFKP